MKKSLLFLFFLLSLFFLNTPSALAAATCGADNGLTLSAPPTRLCTDGNPSAVADLGANWNWVCIDTANPTIFVGCSAIKTTVSTNGQCGADHGSVFVTLSSSSGGLCAKGTVANFSGSGPWTWTCAGISGGTSAFCQASKVGVVSPPPTGGPYNVDARAIGIKYGNVADLVTFILKAILGFSGAGFLIMILYGAFKYTTSQGDKTGVTEAQKTISSAVIGLAIAAAFFAIISLLQTVLGVSLFNITI